MTIKLNHLTEINQYIFRNINGAFVIDEFDDLSTNANAKEYARRLTEDFFPYHTIDYLFQLNNWESSRFGNGTYPVWYGSLALQTSFHETLFHWHRTFILAPGFKQHSIKCNRAVFEVHCHASLIDLRKQCDETPDLIHPDITNYAFTQNIGKQIQQQGFPGLITKSARHQTGENVAVFNKKILSSVKEHGRFIYEFRHKDSTLNVYNQITNAIELTVALK